VWAESSRKYVLFIGSLKAGFVTERSELGSCRAFSVQYPILNEFEEIYIVYWKSYAVGEEIEEARGHRERALEGKTALEEKREKREREK